MTTPTNVLHNTKTGQRFRFLRTGRETRGQLLELESTFRPRSAEPPPHYHPQQVEDFRVLAGALTVRIDGQVQVLGPGDTLHVPPGTVHSMWNSGDAETVVNWVVQPALDTEVFFRTTTGLANDGRTNDAGMPPLLQVALLANRFSNVFRLVRPAFAVQYVLFALLTPLAYGAGYRPTYRKYLG